MRLLRRNKGFTFVEMIVAAAALILIIGLFSYFFLAGHRSYDRTIEGSVLQEASRKAILSMLDELQQSRDIIFPGIKDGRPLTVPVTVLRNKDNERIMYYKKDSSIVRHVIETDSSETIADNIDDIIITRLGEKLLAVRIVVFIPETDKKSQIVTSFFIKKKI